MKRSYKNWSFSKLFACWVICHASVVVRLLFSKLFQKINSRILPEVSNNLNPDRDIHSVGPDSGPNFLQSYQQTTKAGASKERVKAFLYCRHTADWKEWGLQRHSAFTFSKRHKRWQSHFVFRSSNWSKLTLKIYIFNGILVTIVSHRFR